MAFRNENTVAKRSVKSSFQVGRDNIDTGSPNVEKGILLPWPNTPELTWIYYDCAIGAMLDSGIVVHNRLPQVNNAPDSLAMADLADSNLDRVTAGDGYGVNLRCKDQYADIVQRMGHARYWFRLWGQAIRIGMQVPIPGIRTIGGVPAIPYDKNPQWAFNRITPYGNYSGIVMWHAVWSLWYTTAVPPTSNVMPAANPAMRVSDKTPTAQGIQMPYSLPDDNAEQHG